MSLASPIGNDIDTAFKNALAGKSGIREITGFCTREYRTKIAGFVDMTGHKSSRRIYDKTINMAIYTAKQILKDDSIRTYYNKDKIGIVIGTAEGPSYNRVKYIKKLMDNRNFSSFQTITSSMSNLIGGAVALETGFQGANITVSTTCTSSGNALSVACEYIKNRIVDACLVIGVDCPINAIFLKNWDKMKILSKMNHTPEKACKPFSYNRDGTILSEGAGAVFLESYHHAKKRKAVLAGEILGYGTSNSSKELLKPCLESQVLCLNQALYNAKVKTTKIDYIQAHGNGTYFNDLCETRTIKEVFKKCAYKIPLSTIKSMIGHTAGSSTIMSLIFTLLMIKKSIILPTINFEEKDPECDLNVTPNNPVNHKIKTALINSFGFGGNNYALVIRAL